MGSGKRQAAISFVLLVLMLDSLGVGLVLPVLPRVIAQFTHGDLAAASHQYGLFLALYSVAQFVFAPIVGGLSDQFGRRVVILTSLAGAGLDYLLLAYAPSLGWLFAGRILAGMTGASFAAATAYIADITPPEKRAASFGMSGAAFGIGFVLGPAVGGALGNVSLQAPFLAAAALNLLNFMYGVFVLPESLAKENRRAFSLRRANPFGAMLSLGRSPATLRLTATMTCVYLAYSLLQSTWALFTEARFSWSPLEIGISLMVFGLVYAIGQAAVVGRIVPKLGEHRAAMLGLALNLAGYSAFAFTSHPWLMYALIVPFALSGIADPAIRSLFTREVGVEEQGELQGSLGSLMSATSIVAPIIGTSLFARFAPPDSTPYFPGAAFAAAGLINAVGLMMLRAYSRVHPTGRKSAPIMTSTI